MVTFDPRGLIECLEQNRVEYIVIGGIAVGAHGYERATKDLDIVPDPDRANLGRLATALEELNAAIDGVDADELGIALDTAGLSMGGNFVLSTSKGRLDIMQFQGDRDLYELLTPTAIGVNLGYARILICSLKDLLDLKQDAGRPQDLVDIEKLKQLSDPNDD